MALHAKNYTQSVKNMYWGVIQSIHIIARQKLVLNLILAQCLPVMSMSSVCGLKFLDFYRHSIHAKPLLLDSSYKRASRWPFLD
jgi:hypothetical protein